MADFNILHAQSDADISHCFPVMQVLRPHLTGAEDLLVRVRQMQAQSDWSLIYVEDQGAPVACSGFRIADYLAYGKTLYVDDLICLESHRGKGYAESLMRWLESHARKEACAVLHLDSGTHRLPAHRFYHRLKLGITSFHFAKKL